MCQLHHRISVTDYLLLSLLVHAAGAPNSASREKNKKPPANQNTLRKTKSMILNEEKRQDRAQRMESIAEVEGDGEEEHITALPSMPLSVFSGKEKAESNKMSKEMKMVRKTKSLRDMCAGNGYRFTRNVN